MSSTVPPHRAERTEGSVSRPGPVPDRDRGVPTRAADAMIDALIVRERVDVFFGLPGGAISPFHDALARRAEVRTVTSRHEADAVFAAAGYAQSTGKLGVALVTSGPGMLNAINALASAHLEGLPVLLLVGEAPRARFGHGALQEGSSYGLDLIHMVRSITCAAIELHDAGSALPQLLSLVSTMKRGRMGCGVMTCPVDVAQQPAVPMHLGLPREELPVLDEHALDRASLLLAAARRPVIYAGNGVRRGDGPAALRALAERLQIPVITTPHGKGVFPESHPLALGVFGWGAHPSAVEYLKRGADCVLVAGSSLSEVATNSWSPWLQAPGGFIQIDVDPTRIGRSYQVDVAIVGHAAPALRSIAVRLEPRSPRRYGIVRNTDPLLLSTGPDGHISPQRALWELQRVMPAPTCYASDLGEHMQFAFHYLEIDDPSSFHIQLGLCSMGSGLGAAVGLAATRRRPVAIVTGDGCLSMQPGPLATAAAERLPIVFAVLNDARLAMCEIGHEAVYGRRPDYGTQLDVVKLAEGLGLRARRITRPDELLALGPLDPQRDGPLVLDIQIDRGVRMPPNPRNAVLAKQPGVPIGPN